MKKLRNLLAVAATSWALTTTASINAAILTVSNANDSGSGSLRQAITDANQNSGPDTIVFNIPTNSPGFNGTVFTINPLSGLPSLTGANTTIDGATQTAFTGDTNPAGPEVMLNGSQVGFVLGGLDIQSSGNTVNSLILNGFNNTGIRISGPGATFNTVTGCYLGTNPAGNSAVPNTFDGLAITGGASNNTIGGNSPAERNLISGNARNGITIQDITVGSGANNNVVQGNFIGTNAAGQSALGNGQQGVQIGTAASGNLVGGTTPEARNVISGNGNLGVGLIQGNDIVNNRIQGNFIGTDVSGTFSVGNFVGVGLFSTSPNTIGGTAVGAGNIISGNISNGILCSGSTNQVIQGNFIGTNPAGSAAVPNGQGVDVFQGAQNNTIGGTVAGAPNVISGNTGNGVRISDSSTNGNAILANAIYNNGGLGIDLGFDGVTPNDPGDSDTGPNNLQNYPVLSSAATGGSNTSIAGSLNSVANTTYRIEFFANDTTDPSGFGEGQSFVGFTTATTDGTGNVSFNTSVSQIAAGRQVTATATDPNGNTSEFSAAITPGPPLITSPLVATGTAGLPFTYQFTAIGASSLAVSNLAPGLTFDPPSLGAITGIPTTVGIFQVGLSATNSVGTTPRTLTITVQPAPTSGPVFVSANCATGRTGRPFRFQLQTKGGSSATRYAVNNLPSGFNLDQTTGFISGTPTSDGSFSLAVSVIDGPVTTSATLQLTFTSDPTVPVITSANSAILTPGQFFTYTITADANCTFGYIGTDGLVHQGPSNAGLPPDLSFDGIDKISGIFIGAPINGAGAKARDGKLPNGINLAGGIVTNVQLFAANPPNGTGILPLLSFLEPSGAGNIATRLAVGTGENVLIGGFIIEGNAPKKVVIRAIGPSLAEFGVPDPLPDPVLDLNAQSGPLFSNDDWRDDEGQANQISESQLQPGDDREAAILAYLNPGQYTAVVRGKNNSTGNALAEVYDLGTARLADTSEARLANIATRGTVLGGDSVMIGGIIIRRADTRMVVRAIGPSLSAFGISGALQDPTLELRDANAVLLIGNDDWEENAMQAAELQKRMLAPSNPRESALVATLAPGQYTAIVSGKGGTTGVAVVEGYALSDP